MITLLRNMILFTKKAGQGGQGETPWTKGNSWLINTGIADVTFAVKQMVYKDTYAEENITVGISDISFVVTKV